MSSLSSLIRRRELGFSDAQRLIEQALERRTAQNVANDCCSLKTIKLPPNFTHNTYSCRNFVAVLSSRDQTVHNVALFSLKTQAKVWDLKIDEFYSDIKKDFCRVSDSGMVLLDSPSLESKIIVLDGKCVGKLLDMRFWKSITLIGNRILGSWGGGKYVEHPLIMHFWEFITPKPSPLCRPSYNDRRAYYESENRFFAEWDHTGKLVSSNSLDCIGRRETRLLECNEAFWVRLSDSYDMSLPAIIEVYDRAMRTMKTFKLSFNRYKENLPPNFTPGCIVENRLVFGKITHYEHSNDVDPFVAMELKICIYDLVKGAMIKEYPTGLKKGNPQCLVGNQRYIAWFNYGLSKKDGVNYLDTFDETVKKAAAIPNLKDPSEVKLNVAGKLLTIIDRGDFFNWRRRVIDMSDGKLKTDVEYKRSSNCQFAVSNDTVLFTKNCGRNSRIYLEYFS